MTAYDYSRAIATADRLIARYGQTGALVRQALSGGTSFNPGTITETEHACTFAVLDYSAREIDGTRIQATDKKVYLAKASLSIEPTTADFLEIGGKPHKIIAVKPLSPAGTVVMWELQVRR